MQSLATRSLALSRRVVPTQLPRRLSTGPGTALDASAIASAAGHSSRGASASGVAAAATEDPGSGHGSGSESGEGASGVWSEMGELVLFGAGMYVLTNYFINTTQCVGPSMAPSISTDGDVLLTVPFCLYRHLRGGLPQLGSVVISTSPTSPDQTVCKRVLGLPGETITVRPPPGRYTPIRAFSTAPGDREPLIDRPPFGAASYQLVLPRGHVWLQGDNLDDSTDSRIYGPVPLALIQSVAMLRIWPFSTAGALPGSPPLPPLPLAPPRPQRFVPTRREEEDVEGGDIELWGSEFLGEEAARRGGPMAGRPPALDSSPALDDGAPGTTGVAGGAPSGDGLESTAATGTQGLPDGAVDGHGIVSGRAGSELEREMVSGSHTEALAVVARLEESPPSPREGVGENERQARREKISIAVQQAEEALAKGRLMQDGERVAAAGGVDVRGAWGANVAPRV